MKYGIDISEFQGPNFHIPKNIDFIIIRAGYGDYEDKYFKDNYANAKALGLPIGIYWCVDPDLAADVQSSRCLETIINFPPTMGLWVDLEAEDVQDHPSRMSKIGYDIADRLENMGYYTGIYYSLGCGEYLKDLTGRFDSWIACWDDDPEDEPIIGTIKQYGIKNNLDRDACYADFEIYKMKMPSGATPADLSGALRSIIKQLEDIINEFC